MKMNQDIYSAINDLRKEMNNRFDSMETNFVSIDRFKPIESLTWGMVGFVLLAVLGAIIAGVIVKINPASAAYVTHQITPYVEAVGTSIAKL